jgi:hypothetical protein
VERARAEAAAAEEALRELTMDTLEYRLQELALFKAIARISVAAKMSI